MTINEYIAGAIGGVSGIIVGHPFDTTKIQMQTRTSGDHRIKTTMDAFHSVRAQGLSKGFFRGMAFPLSSYAVVNSTFFGVYGNCIKLFSPDPNERANYKEVYLAGCVAGAAQLLVACPVDVVKCTMQAQIPLTKPPKVSTSTIDGTPRVVTKTVYPLKYYNGPLECLWDIAKREGLPGLYKGFGTMFVRDVPSFGLYLLVYESLFHNMEVHELTDKEGIFATVMAGGVAGCASWGVVMPLDVIKSRLQTDHEKKYSGFMDCWRKSVQKAGWTVLFRGMTITMARAFPVNAVTFLIYNQLMKLLDHVNPPAYDQKHI